MSRALQATSTENQNAGEEFVWPEYRPSPEYCHFLERLKRARIERGLSIADMSDEVGLTFRLANEFENLITPLPFCHLELWCQAVGVPFADYLAIYWADEREWDEQREAEERKAEQNAPCIPNTTPAPISRSNRGFGFLNLLRSVAAHIRSHFLSRFFHTKKTPE